ncbi:MAG: acyl-CoA dehydrogenase family protein [Actinomycetota bacterium]
MAGFLQTPPELPDSWQGDRALRETVRFHLSEDLWDAAEAALGPMGELAASDDVQRLAARAESEPPRHVPFAPWGERVDEIEVSPAYTELGRIGIEAGVTALPYEGGPFGPAARIVWGALIALWGPSSALYSCPVAMTDAAARTLLDHGDASESAIVDRLTTRDPDSAWTSGQWMTETAGGSDVRRTGTRAVRDGTGAWRLYGTKWFTSATTSEMALTLARPEGAAEGARGLALFRVQRVLEDGARNQIVVRRLKDKLGTRAVPTAELELQGALAHPVGDVLDGGGVRRIATMLNLTRIHNALGSVGALARGLAWARAYARVREVFGRPLQSMPAHAATLTDVAVDHAAALALTFRCCELVGRVEADTATDGERALLRALTPLAKLATARWAIAGTAECMEALGGVGYCEDSGMPAVVRNAHVLPIWEGTTNVLALDVLRAGERSGAVAAVLQDARAAAASVRTDHNVSQAAEDVDAAVRELERRAVAMAASAEPAEASARSFALGLATTYACARLCLQGSWAARRGDPRTAAAAVRLGARGLVPPEAPEALFLGMDEAPAIAP